MGLPEVSSEALVKIWTFTFHCQPGPSRIPRHFPRFCLASNFCRLKGTNCAGDLGCGAKELKLCRIVLWAPGLTSGPELGPQLASTPYIPDQYFLRKFNFDLQLLRTGEEFRNSATCLEGFRVLGVDWTPFGVNLRKKG